MIAKRGFELLKPGGLMVYSTCSMSPYGTVSPCGLPVCTLIPLMFVLNRGRGCGG